MPSRMGTDRISSPSNASPSLSVWASTEETQLMARSAAKATVQPQDNHADSRSTGATQHSERGLRGSQPIQSRLGWRNPDLERDLPEGRQRFQTAAVLRGGQHPGHGRKIGPNVGGHLYGDKARHVQVL